MKKHVIIGSLKPMIGIIYYLDIISHLTLIIQFPFHFYQKLIPQILDYLNRLLKKYHHHYFIRLYL